jgi:hypothetical protein
MRTISMFLFALAAGLLLFCETSFAAPAAGDWHSAADFYWEKLGHADFPKRIRESGNLRGVRTPSDNSKPAYGLVKYRFQVAATGWHVLEYDQNAFGSINPEAAFDIQGTDGDFLVHQGPDHWTAARIWLKKGQHTLTLKRNHYQGFPAIARWRVRPAKPKRPLEHLSVVQAVRTNIYAANEPIRLKVTSGGQPALAGTEFRVSLLHASSRLAVASTTFRYASSAAPKTQDVELRVGKAAAAKLQQGFYTLFVAPVKGKTRGALRFENLFIVDGAAAKLDPNPELAKKLIADIDCTKTPPHFASSTSIGRLPNGEAYRQTGPRGWHRNQTKEQGDPGFFGYNVTGTEPGKPYLIEFTYPDDAYRTFAVAAFDRNGGYPSGGGADSGWTYPVSNAMHTGHVLHWAKTKKIQVAVINAYADAEPGAVQRIRVYALPRGLNALLRGKPGGRRLAYWHEETGSLPIVYAAPAGSDAERRHQGIANWVHTAAHQGYTTLIPGANVRYPSAYQDLHTTPFATHDGVKSMLIEAKRHGLEVIPELHPLVGRMMWWTKRPPAENDNRMYNNHGSPASPPFEPSLNPLHPESRKWLLGLVREFAERYSQFENMTGISLRFMGWLDPGLWDFGGCCFRGDNHAEDSYGYDDFTFGKFLAETGVKVRTGTSNTSPQRFKARHDAIWNSPTLKKAWYEWKAGKVREIVIQVREEMDAVAPRLTLYLHLAGVGVNSYGRSAGFDPAILANIPGVECINGTYRYGRRSHHSKARQQVSRDYLQDQQWLRAARAHNAPVNYIAGGN